MDTHKYHVFTSKEGGQISYYFTDALTEDLAKRDAMKAAVKYFNKDNPEIQRLDLEIIGLPEKASAKYEWFIGVENMFDKPHTSLNESEVAANEAPAVVDTVKAERKGSKNGNKKAQPKKAAPKQTTKNAKKKVRA